MLSQVCPQKSVTEPPSKREFAWCSSITYFKTSKKLNLTVTMFDNVTSNSAKVLGKFEQKYFPYAH